MDRWILMILLASAIPGTGTGNERPDDSKVTGSATTLDSAIVITPGVITLLGQPGTRVDQPLVVKNNTAGSLTITIAESTVNAAERVLQPASGELYLTPLIHRLRSQNLPLPLHQPAGDPLVFTTIIQDTRGDNFLVGVDVLEVLYQKRTIPIIGSVLDLRMRLLNPDSAVAGFLSLDADQDFGTGVWPPPFGIGPRTRDNGSEFEILVDASGILADSLGLGNLPIAVIFRTSDTSLVYIPIEPDVTHDSVLTVTVSGIPLGSFGLNDPDQNLNIGAIFARLTAAPFPDYAPDYGHGTVGTESGVSWIRESPATFTVGSGDSAVVNVSVLAAKPIGSYAARLKFSAQGQVPVYVPVTMNVTGLGAHIVLSATGLADTLVLGSSSSFPLTISNTGDMDLLWGFVDTANTSWASVSPSFGITGPGQVSQSTIEFRTAGLQPGATYVSRFLVLSNDAASPSIIFPLSLRVEPPVSARDQGESFPTTFVLYQNYPNPFNPRTTITFDIPPGSGGLTVSLGVYDLLGRKVATLVDGRFTPGRYKAVWDADGAASGMYLYRFVAGEFVQTKRMGLLH